MESGANADAVIWSVDEGADGGIITNAGVYTAPTLMGTYHVIVKSQSNPDKTAAAAVTVSDTFKTENGLVIDFTSTRFTYVLNANASRYSPMVIFRVSNTGSTSKIVEVQPKLNGHTTNRPVTQCPRTEIRPGDSVFFKYSLEYGWSQGSDSNGPSEYPVGYSGVDKLDFTVITDPGDPNHPPVSVNIPMRITVSRPTELDLPAGNIHIAVLLKDDNGGGAGGRRVFLSNEYASTAVFADSSGHASFDVAESPGYWLWVDDNGVQSNTIHIDGNDIKPVYTLTVRPQSKWNTTVQLVNTVKDQIGFWRGTASKDGTKMLLPNGMENWSNQSLAPQSKLFMLDVQTGTVLWTHNIGNQSWSADISDDGNLAVVANAGSTPGLPTPTSPFIRLLDARNGTVIWTKPLSTLDVPQDTKNNPSFASMGVKFSHDASVIFVGLEGCDYSFLLNRTDGSVIWKLNTGMHAREAVFTANDRYMYFVPVDGWARKISVADGREAWRQFVGGFVFVNGIDLSSDEQHLCVGTKSGDLTLLNTSDGSIVFQRHSAAWVVTCRFSPDGKSLIACDSLGGGLYDITGKQLWFRQISTADERFSSDGRWIMVTQNYNAEIYDLDGNRVLQIGNAPPGVSTIHVGWLNNDDTRYICAAEGYDSNLGEGDVIQIYSLRIVVP